MKTFKRFAAVLFCASLVPAGTSAENIQTAVQTALTTNPGLKAADQNFRAYVFDLLKQKGNYEPEVTLFGDVGKEYVYDPNGLSVADNGKIKTTYELGVIADLPIYDGHRRANQVYAAAAHVDRSSLELLDASEMMALMVAEQYINVARQQRLLYLARQNLERLREILEQADNLVQGGRVPVSELYQVEAGIFNAQAAIAEIQRSLAASKARFRTLVGREPSGTLQLPSPVRPPATLDAVMAESVRNSYRVKIADANVDISGFEEKIADAEFQPQLSLQAGASIGENLDGARGYEDTAFVGLQMSWKLYGGTRVNQRRALSARKNEAVYQRLATIRSVEELAITAWQTYQIDGVRAGYLKSRIEANEKLVESYEREFQLATRKLLDLLIAENGLFNARFEYANTRALLAFSGYRALAAQSKLARHFGIKDSEVFLSQMIEAKGQERPFDVISKGTPLVNR